MSGDGNSSSRAAFASAGFQPHLVPIPARDSDPTLSDLEIYALRFQYGGDAKQPSTSPGGEPLLLIHGHPQNLAIWHRLAPALAEKAKRDIVCVDLRGHGHSSVPRVRNFIRRGHDTQQAATAGSSTDADRDEEAPSEEALRQRFSKRECGRDLLYVMTQYFRYPSFAIVGHDRGARIAHRMAVDNPQQVTRLMVLDIVPTLDLYERAGSSFALKYWHWFFLTQAYPIPEEMIGHSPKTYLHALITRFQRELPATDEQGPVNVFTEDNLKSYLAQLSSPPRLHAMCEDYRSSAPGGVDLVLDKLDRDQGRKVQQPLRAVWGEQGLNEKLFGRQGCLDLWQNVCQQDVTGTALPCGHYIPEEVPELLLQEILTFFAH